MKIPRDEKNNPGATTRVKDAFARWSRRSHDGENTMNTEELQQDTPETAEVNIEAGSEGAGHSTGPEASEAEFEQLRGERDQLKDRLARLQADFDNARKRDVKERQDVREYAIQSAIEPFLGVMDNFQLALKADGSAEQLRAGVELILKQMDAALAGLNVQAVDAVGAQFDPRIHEALGSIETLEHPDHQVLEEIRRGYKLREKLLRPALVRIAVNLGQKSE